MLSEVEVILFKLLKVVFLVGLVMPIEFACEECGSVLRVPDGTSGKRSRCPTCKHEQEIPWVVSSGQQAVASDKLSIPCPKCQHHLVCSPDLLGTRGQCKKCQHIFTISTEPVSSETAAPALVFHCPQCRQLFEGREEMRGRKGKCHVCKSVFMIELEPAQPKRASSTTASAQTAKTTTETAKPTVKPQSKTTDQRPATSDEDELILIEDPESKSQRIDRTPTVSSTANTPKTTSTSSTVRPAAKPKPTGPIRFQCTQCTGVMEVPGSTAGLETECPYCQTIQEIPSESMPLTATAPAGFANAGSGNQSAAFDPLGGLDFSVSNPYAAPAQSWSAPAVSGGAYSAGGTKRGVSVGNVLQLAFDSLFPSCFMFYLYVLLFAITSGVVNAIIGAIVGTLRGSVEPMYLVIPGVVILVLFTGMLSAWFAGAMSRTALNAVRKKQFDFGESFDPGGAFNASILVVGGGLLFLLLMYLPIILQATTGALTGLGGLMILWILLFVPVLIIYSFATSLALFAGADGESSMEAIQTSASLVFRHFGTTLAVFLLSGLISGILALPTLGCSYVLPIYCTAALYHLASKNR